MIRDALDAFLEDLGGLFRARRLYPSGNEQVSRAAEKASRALARVGQRVRIARVGDDVVVEDRSLGVPPLALKALLDRLAESGWECLQIEQGAREEEFAAWIESVVSRRVGEWEGLYIRAGSLLLEQAATSGSRLAEAAAGYLSLLPGVREALSDLAQEKTGGLVRAREIVRAIAGQLASGAELANPIRGLRIHDDYTFTHALNVCVISAALSRALNLAKGQVDAVSLAALCHDVGKEKVPTEILNKQGPLDAGEKAIIEQHPTEGASILLRLPERVDPLLPIVAYQHHMGADGSGYPSRPDVQRAHPASLLVALADVYDALRTVRAYQQPRSAAGAFTVMLQQARRGVLHEGLLGVFARLLDVLRPGDRVSLSDGRTGVVLQQRAHDPLLPIVEIEGGEILDPERSPPVWIEAVVEASE